MEFDPQNLVSSVRSKFSNGKSHQSESQSSALQNVGSKERIVSALIGSFMMARGLRHGLIRGAVMEFIGGALLHRAVGGHCKLYKTLGINTASGQGEKSKSEPVEIDASLTIQKSPEELYRTFSDPEKLGQITGGWAQVQQGSGDQMTWSLRMPWGKNIEWKTRMIEERPGELLRWETAGGGLSNQGRLELRPAAAGRGTEAKLSLSYVPPFGALGQRVAHWMQPLTRSVAQTALRRLQSLAETGEVPSLLHNPSGRESTHTTH